ncbi:MAG TPA: hypothetical protein DCS88_00515 [Alphaproteobacteria bacterium]|nr:hypothetical protein [Alphaproteobacteria bacterium]
MTIVEGSVNASQHIEVHTDFFVEKHIGYSGTRIWLWQTVGKSKGAALSAPSQVSLSARQLPVRSPTDFSVGKTVVVPVLSSQEPCATVQGYAQSKIKRNTARSVGFSVILKKIIGPYSM